MKNPAVVFLTIVISFFLFSCKKKEKPVVETLTLTNITTTSATCDGKVISDGSDIIISCGVCWSKNSGPTVDDKRTSETSSSGDFSSVINDLDISTVYYARAYATNNAGTGYGIAISFKTLGDVPSAELPQATSITSTSAVLSAITNSHYVSTSVSFEYGTSTNYNSFILAIQSPINGNSDVSVSANAGELLPGTTYHYRVKAENSLGTTYSNDFTFTTLGGAPLVTKPIASDLTATAVTVYSSVNPNYASATVSFEYGTTGDYGNSVAATQSPVTGSSGVQVGATILSLSPATLYHIRVKAVNALGTTNSEDLTVTTLGKVPTSTTIAASGVMATTARLNAIVNPNYLSTNSTFEYGKTSDYGNRIKASPDPVTGNNDEIVSAIATGLEPLTLYHFRITALNSMGTVSGSDLTFTTIENSTRAATMPATVLSTSSTSLNASVNPNGLSTTVSFEYGSTNALGSSISAIPGLVTGSSDIAVNATLTGLSVGVTYYFRVKAENTLGVEYGDILTFVTASPWSVNDVDGNVYSIVQIGSQYWLGENLKTTKYNDGTSIPNITDGTSWVSLTTPAYCWYNNDAAAYKNTYGALYNFYAASSGKLCPTGWHVPSDSDFAAFTTSLGDISYAGGKIKESGTLHWNSPNTGATNVTGFTALPAGYTTDTGSFDGVGLYECWWSSTPDNSFKSWYRSVGYQTAAVEVRNGSLNQRGFSIRCVKD